jgi:hypothetical protein
MPDAELLKPKLTKLMRELQDGESHRNSFQPWEIEILLDIHDCVLPKGRRKTLLERYHRAAQKQIDKGAPRILKLSEYMERSSRRAASDPGGLS